MKLHGHAPASARRESGPIGPAVIETDPVTRPPTGFRDSLRPLRASLTPLRGGSDPRQGECALTSLTACA
jgi:hypothetical protein